MPKIIRGNVRITGKGRVFLETLAGTDTTQAITQHAPKGKVTSSTTDLAADTSQNITVTNRFCTANSHVSVAVAGGGNGEPVVSRVTPSAGSFIVRVRNVHASVACTAAYSFTYVITGSDLQDAN